MAVASAQQSTAAGRRSAGGDPDGDGRWRSKCRHQAVPGDRDEVQGRPRRDGDGARPHGRVLSESSATRSRGRSTTHLREFADQREPGRTRASTRLSPATTARVKNDRAVWSGATVDLTGRVSPDGRFITFVDWADGRLMLHDVTTNLDRALTPAAVPVYSQSAQWSAISRDGKQVVYEWSANGRAEVRIATVPASGFVEPRQIVLASAASFNSFDWAPDGKSIATAFERRDGTGEIGLIAVVDGSFRSLKSIDRSALNTLRSSTSIFISLDGKYIAYDRPPTESSRQRDAFVLSIADGREIPVVVHGANDAVMGWSPDGSRLLFSSDRTGSIGLWAQPFSDGKPQGSPELLKSDIGPTYSLGCDVGRHALRVQTYQHQGHRDCSCRSRGGQAARTSRQLHPGLRRGRPKSGLVAGRKIPGLSGGLQ